MAKTEPKGGKPLDALATSPARWLEWQLYRGNAQERFTRDRIVSFAQISGQRFLFGGIFQITGRENDRYDVEYTNQHRDLIGRLILELNTPNKRSTVFKPDTVYTQSHIAGLYETKFNGEPFISYELINHSFSAMEIIIHNALADWRSALSSVYGIYLITDDNTGKQYVGSAYGDNGIWGRWQHYVDHFHGSNKQLMELFEDTNATYFRENFRFSILEVLSANLAEADVIAKESLWKDKLFTRIHGYNSN